MSFFELPLGKPLIVRWAGTASEDPYPIVLEMITRDAMGRIMTMVDKEGNHYDFGRLISWRVIPYQEA